MAEKQVVVFKIADEEFGVDINEVKEIIKIQDITKVPDSAEFIKGIINLREKVIVVMDLALKLRLPVKEYDKNTRIVIIELNDNFVGMIVDSATEVLRIPSENVQEAPQVITSKISGHYIEGVGLINERMIIFLDLVKVINEDDRENIKTIQEVHNNQQTTAQPDKQSVNHSNNNSKPTEESNKTNDSIDTSESAITVTQEEEAKVTPEDNNKPLQTESHSNKISILPTLEHKKETETLDSENYLSRKDDNKSENDTIITDEQSTENTIISEPKDNDKKTDEEKKSEEQGNLPPIKIQQDVSEEHHFVTHEGKTLKNVKELHEYIIGLSDEKFKEFVNEDNNDFFNWIKYAVKDDDLAEKIKNIKDKNDISDEILNRIKEDIYYEKY